MSGTCFMWGQLLSGFCAERVPIDKELAAQGFLRCLLFWRFWLDGNAELERDELLYRLITAFV